MLLGGNIQLLSEYVVQPIQRPRVCHYFYYKVTNPHLITKNFIKLLFDITQVIGGN